MSSATKWIIGTMLAGMSALTVDQRLATLERLHLPTSSAPDPAN